jgi:nicotinamide-nucleotide amidase
VAAAGHWARIFALPGVPAEMRTMWRGTVEAAILDMLPERATIMQRRIKCFGAGESAIEAMLPDIIQRGRDPLVGITAHEATITLRIAARGRDAAECQAKIAATEATIRACLGPLVYGVEDDELEDAVVAALAAVGLTLATAEIGTDGRVAALIAQAAARGREAGCFRGGLVLPPAAVPGGAAALAARARAEHGAAVGLGIGPVEPAADGRSEIEVALATDANAESFRHMLGGGPFLAGSRAAKFAIDRVRLWALARG